MPRLWRYSATLQQQMQDQNWNQSDTDNLDRLKRSIQYSFNQQNYRDHRLDGRGQQALLEGCYAMDFLNGGVGGPGRWRLLYDVVSINDANDFEVNLLAVLDYHGGQAMAPLYPPGHGNFNLS